MVDGNSPSNTYSSDMRKEKTKETQVGTVSEALEHDTKLTLAPTAALAPPVAGTSNNIK